MNPAAKDCLDTFMLARNNSLLWGKTNVDKYGKAKIFDPETGQPIISGMVLFLRSSVLQVNMYLRN